LFFNNSIYTIANINKKSLVKWKKTSQNFFSCLAVEGLSKENILELAKRTEFMKRKPKKIDPYDFLGLVCTLAVIDTPSFNSIAAKYSIDYSIPASKQAISKKMKKECLKFFMTILALIINNKLKRTEAKTMLLIKEYTRVLVQDSTLIQLPLRLFDSFSGMRNGSATNCTARIQGVYDILTGSFIDFSIDPYSKNDLLAAPELTICKNDLVLRDRGYFTVDEVERHKVAQAECIYRFKASTTILSPRTGKPIDLVKLLKKKGSVDMEVCLHNEKHTKVRLVAFPVSEDIANRRRANAKNKTNRSKQPSQTVLQLMSWTIFITTISEEKACFEKIFALYSLRWRIEIIFKAWKSHASFAQVHNISDIHLRILLTARFIMIVVFVHYVYNPWIEIIRSHYKRELSLLKIFSYLTSNIDQLFIFLYFKSNRNQCIAEKNLLKYCTYDKRKRLNFNQILMSEPALS